MWLRRSVIPAMALAMGLGCPAGNAVASDQKKNDAWEIEITPRFWLLDVGINPFLESNQFQQTNEEAVFPMFGFSLRVAPPEYTRSDFLFTFLRGSDVVKGKSFRAPGITSNHQTDAVRTDVEFLYRRRIEETNVLWFTGFRWIFLEEDSKADNGFTWPASNTGTLEEETSFYMAEVGVSFSTPVDMAADHILFANFTTGVGYERQVVLNRATDASPDVSGVFPFVDANVGYQYIISDNLSAHLRYRVFALQEHVRDRILALHGPEVGVGLRF